MRTRETQLIRVDILYGDPNGIKNCWNAVKNNFFNRNVLLKKSCLMQTPDAVMLELDDTKKSFEGQCERQLHCEICRENFEKLSTVITLYYVLLYLGFITFRWNLKPQKQVPIWADVTNCFIRTKRNYNCCNCTVTCTWIFNLWFAFSIFAC